MFTVVVPAYNEEKSVESTAKKLVEVMEKTGKPFEIIFVNDGSKDNTTGILKNIASIKVINHPYNKGYGASLKSGISNAQYEWIVMIDADGTYPIADIPKFIKETVEFDLVSGARTGKKVYVPLLRRPAKWILTKTANYLTGTKIPDLNCGLRVFRKSIAKEFWHLLPQKFSFTTTMLIAALMHGYNVKFIPINYFKREGKSTIKPSDFLNFLTLIFRTVLYFDPLKFFLPASVLLFILGVLRAVRDYGVAQHIGNLAIIIVLSSFQILFLGLLADLINRRR